MSNAPVSRGKLITVWDGQWGSTGKGQIAWHISEHEQVDAAVRVGGPNAGHTFYATITSPVGIDVRKMVARTIPCCAYNGYTRGFIGAAGLFHIELLLEELKNGYLMKGNPIKLSIDPNAVIITEEHMAREAELKGNIGSTGEGVGAATADKVMRNPKITVAPNIGNLIRAMEGRPECSEVRFPSSPTYQELNRILLTGKTVLLEGTQGFGLGLHHSGYYPFCTSRECTPWALYAETGVSPKNAAKVESVMVIRTYPIRVGGNSGPMPGETTWEKLANRTGGHVKPEYTTVTKKQRRIAEMDIDMLRNAVLIGCPDVIALTFLDYVFPELANVTSPSKLNEKHWDYLSSLSRMLRVPIKYVSTGPGYTMELPI